MKDRIEIDGVWYVREDQADQEELDLDYTSFDGRVYETDLYCFEVTRILEDDGTPYPGCTVEFTDKRDKPFKKDFWDNENWFLGILDENPASMVDLKDMCCGQGVREFKYVLNDLVKVGWLNKN